MKWQMAVPTGTFTDRSVFEVIELLHGLDFHHLELTPGQKLRAEGDVVAIHTMAPAEVAALMAQLKAVKMDIVSYGPVDLGTDEASARAVFAFAKEIKAKAVIASPAPALLEGLDKLATEYGVNLAVKATDGTVRPEGLMEAIGGRSARVGSYEDLAALKQAGVDPLTATKATGAKVVDVRVSDVDAQGKTSVVGAGTVDVLGVLTELKARGFKGIVTVGYEPGPEASVINGFINSVNATSDAITKVAAIEAAAGK